MSKILLQFKGLGNLFENFGEMSGSRFKGITDIQNMTGDIKKSFNNFLRLNSNGISQYTMEQIRAKSAVLGLTDSLTIQATAMAKDADFSAKAATGTLTFGKALDKGIGSTDELVHALKESGKLTGNNIDEVNKAAIMGGEAYRTTVSNIINETDEIKNSTIKIGAAATQSTGFINSFKQSFKGLYATLKPMLPLIATIGTAVAAYKGFKFLDDKFTLTFDTAQKHLEDSASAYSNTVSELENLNSQTDQYKSTLESIGNNYDIKFSGAETVDEMIDKIRSIDGKKINLTDESTINKLERENDLLETRKNLLATTADSQQRKAAEDARKSINFASEEISFKKANGEAANHRPDGSDVKYKVDRKRYVQELVGEMERAQQQIDEAQDKLNDKSTSKADKKAYKKQFEQATENLEKYKNEATEIATKLSEESKSFYDEQTGLVIDDFEDDAKAVKDIVDMVFNFNLSPEEKDLNSLNSFFSSTAGNAIGDYLNNVVAESGNAEDALNKFKELGLSLDDIGVSQDSFIKYFQDVAKSAEQAKEKASAVGTTLSDVDAAFKSENQDANWTKFADYATQARDLAKQGKWGTDDLQKSIEWVLPKFDVESQLKKNGGDFEYIAEVYEKKYKDAEKLYKKYFDAENPKDSAVNFQNDLIDKGLLKKDETGLTGTFKNTAKAAKDMGLSIEATEAALRNLESYGFEWDDVMFSGEGITDYENALNKIKAIRDSMDEGETKDRLNELIDGKDGKDGWEEQYQKYQDDLSKLTSEEQIVHIEFEYSLATIQQQIDEYKDKIAGGDNSVENYANVIAGNERYINTAKEGIGLNNEEVKLPVILETTENSIADLQNELKTASGEEKVEIQAELANKQELEKAILNSFSDQNPEITPEADTSEINKAWDKYFDKEQHITVNAELSDSDIRSKLSSLKAGSTITYTANVDGVQSAVTAVKNEDGTISYTANVGDVEQTVNAVKNEDGTITYTVNEVEGTKVTKGDNKSVTQTVNEVKGQQVSKEATPATQIVNQKLGKLVPTTAPAASQAVNRYVANNVSTTVPSATQIVHRKYDGPNDLSGTAHKSGTAKDAIIPSKDDKDKRQKSKTPHNIPKSSGHAFASGTIEDNSFIKDKWRTKKSETALTGEEGQELVATRDNKWFTVGDNGAEFAHIPAGSVVFNAKQTEELLKNGSINSRGKAYLSGTAYASGNGGPTLTSSSSSTTKKKKTSSKKSTSKGKTTKKKSTTKKDTKKFKETFDWIEVAIDRIERAIESVDLKASSTYRSWSNRNKNLKTEISKVNTEITKQNEGYKRYNKQAEKVSKSAIKNAKDGGYTKKEWNTLKEKAKNGKIDINTIKNEKLAERIKEYQQW
ncbi:hypothetical protein FMM74_020515 [Lachnospiraceae bacterium MD308]|nr:hypothetical protein [Lachnospiraceae bacterium MD308]